MCNFIDFLNLLVSLQIRRPFDGEDRANPMDGRGVAITVESLFMGL